MVAPFLVNERAKGRNDRCDAGAQSARRRERLRAKLPCVCVLASRSMHTSVQSLRICNSRTRVAGYARLLANQQEAPAMSGTGALVPMWLAPAYPVPCACMQWTLPTTYDRGNFEPSPTNVVIATYVVALAHVCRVLHPVLEMC